MKAKQAFRTLFPKLERSTTFPLASWIQHLAKFGLNAGGTYPVHGRATNSEGPVNDYDGYVDQFYKGSGVIFGVCRVRRAVFAQVTFKWRPKDGDSNEHSLIPIKGDDLFQAPFPGQSTTQFLSRAIQDIDLMGNAYWLKEFNPTTNRMQLRRLRPDYVDIVLDADPNTTPFFNVIGYTYYPGGGLGMPFTFLPEEIIHWIDTPDPSASYRGMSWMTPVIKDIMIEQSANDHRISFFKRGAQSNIAISLKDPSWGRYDDETIEQIQARFRASYTGSQNAYEPIFIAGGADIIPIESDLSSLDMANVSGRAENHIAMASGIHPTVVASMEGMQGASLNSGNFKTAERRDINMTFHPLWHGFVDALDGVIDPPRPTRKHKDELRLWYSTEEVSILNDDRAERVEIRKAEIEAITKMVREGIIFDSAVEYMKSGNLDALEHNGMVSVQLYEPGVNPEDGGSNLAPKKDDPAAKDPAPSGGAPQPNLDPKTGQAEPPSSPVKEK